MTDQEVIEAVECICGDDLCEDLSMRRDDLTGDLKEATDKLLMIYRVTHSHLRNAKCFDTHSNWRTEAKLILAKMRKES